MRKFFTPDDPVVPTHHPRVLVETAVAQGADRETLLAGTGVSMDALSMPETRLCYAQYRALCVNALRLTSNPALGLDVGVATQLPQLGVFGLAVLSSATLRGALDLAVRYFQVVAPIWDLSLQVDGDAARLSVVAALPLGRLEAFATEILLAAFDAQARGIFGRPPPVRRLRLHYPRPVYHARYAEFYDVPIEFDAKRTEVEFDAAFLDERLPHADPATATLAERYCARETQPRPPTRGLVPQVRERLAAALADPPNLEALARALQTSDRSLRRALQNVGTSYTELLDEIRRERALEWVRSTQLPLEELAERLGFGDVRSFRRAFKRWTGVAPGAARNQRT